MFLNAQEQTNEVFARSMIWIIMEIEKGVIHWTDNILLFIYLFIF